MITKIGPDINLPSAYFDPLLIIVPLRLAWSQNEGMVLRQRMSRLFHVSWTWFMQPIISTNDKLSHFGYQTGDCPVSEEVGPLMVNLPCNMTEKWAKKMGNIFKKLH